MARALDNPDFEESKSKWYKEAARVKQFEEASYKQVQVIKTALRESIEGYKIRPLEQAIAAAEECDKFDHKASRW